MNGVGFTGTRHGMTDAQRVEVLRWIEDNEVPRAGHGDCVGSDEEFHEICLYAGVAVTLFPPSDPKLRAFCKGAVVVHKPAPYIKRNRHIVGSFPEGLLAVPKEDVEPLPARGQGTWSTIRYARSTGVPVVFFWPDGKVEDTRYTVV